MTGRRVYASHDPDMPAYVHHVQDGWEICTMGGIRVHCFTSWYDECQLLPGGHAELCRKRGAHTHRYRFRWCGESRRYHPDHPTESGAAAANP